MKALSNNISTKKKKKKNKRSLIETSIMAIKVLKYPPLGY